MTETPDDKPTVNRRSFLRGIGLTAAATAASAGATAALAVEGAATPPPATSGYRETEHVRRVYDTARF